MTKVAFIGESEDLYVAVDRSIAANALLGGTTDMEDVRAEGEWVHRRVIDREGRPTLVEAHTYVAGENPHEGKVRAITCTNIAYVEGVDE